VTEYASISDLLDSLAPAVEAEPDGWRDVLARAELLDLAVSPTTPDRQSRNVRGSRRRRGLLLVGLLVLLFALAVATSYAIGHPVIDFGSAQPASPQVVRDFDSFSQGAPPGMDPQVNATETRLIGVFGGHRLWVAPTKAGGLCYELANATGGCDALGTTPLDVSWRCRHTCGAVDGHVNGRWADGLEIKLDDGSTVHPHVVWVSPPINAGFFYYRAPEGRHIETVLALDGSEVVAAAGKHVPGGPHPFADLSRRSEVGKIDTAAGPVTLWTAPTRTEGRCAWLEFQGRETQLGCLPKGYEHQAGLGYNTRLFGGHTVLVGTCGYRAVQLVHGDGSVRTVDCGDGLLFADLQPADLAGEMCAANEQGRIASSCSLVPPSNELARRSSSQAVEVVALLGRGISEGRATLGGERPYAVLSKRAALGRITTDIGTVTLWTAPTATGGRCTWVALRGEEVPVVPCSTKEQPYQTKLAYAILAVAGRMVLVGTCDYGGIEIVNQHGRSRAVACSNGLVFTYLGASDRRGVVHPRSAKGTVLPISLSLRRR